jgi:hypothetical protein
MYEQMRLKISFKYVKISLNCFIKFVKLFACLNKNEGKNEGKTREN